MPLQFLKGVGPRKAADLKKAGLLTVEDLLFRFPLRYEDRSRLQPIVSLKPGQVSAVSGRSAAREPAVDAARRLPAVHRARAGRERPDHRPCGRTRRFSKTSSGRTRSIVLYGKVEYWGSRGLQITDPEFEIIRDDADGRRARRRIHTGRIVPVYERTGSVTTNMQRRFVWQALEQLAGRSVRSGAGRHSARARRGPLAATRLQQAHFPDARHAGRRAQHAFSTPAQRRLIFEDFFVFQLGPRAAAAAERADAQEPRAVVSTTASAQAARAVLPFKLTDGQRQALAEIVADMQKAWPMQRLLQGDVGAGKTIVALLAALVAMENGFQVAFMAPTEILAEQHFATLSRWLATTRFRVALLSGRVDRGGTARRCCPSIERGDVHLVVGTHALVQEHVKFRALALAVIDEQHRFGVLQRGDAGRPRACTPTCW